MTYDLPNIAPEDMAAMADIFKTQIGDYLVNRYSERVESAAELSKRVNQSKIQG